MLPAIFLIPKVIGILKFAAVGFGLLYVSSCVEDKIAGEIAQQNEQVMVGKIDQVEDEAELSIELEQAQVANEIEFQEENRKVNPIDLGEKEGMQCYQVSCVVE